MYCTKSKIVAAHNFERDIRSQVIEEISAATTHEDAIEIVAEHLGFIALRSNP